MNSRQPAWRKVLALLPALGPLAIHAADPQLNPAGFRRGSDALHAWADRLPILAATHRTDVWSLRHRLLHDPALAIDPAGSLVYSCPTPDRPASETAAAPGAVTPVAPLTDTFRLHSLPGATRRLVLDVDGCLVQGTAWNMFYTQGTDILILPFDQDGDRSTFSDAELIAIQEIWQRVAEDFAPFNIDVTTEDPGDNFLAKTSDRDTEYGGRLCIGGPAFGGYGANVGGVAYVGSFTSLPITPGFVFSDHLGGDARLCADAASHEAGHMLGLSHDGILGGSPYAYGHGSGPTGWAPIMGAGYYQPVSQWSRGEYAGANNTEDDLAIIASYVGYRPDDHGDSPASATTVQSGLTFAEAGIIGGDDDVDLFEFTTSGGEVTLAAQPDPVSPNLDILLEIRSGSRKLLHSANPPGALDASLTVSLPAGTYYASIRGVGAGDPATNGYSAYASKGAFTLTGLLPNGVTGASPIVRVQSIDLTVERAQRGDSVQATVMVTDAASSPVAGAQISAIWSGVVAGTVTGKSGRTGAVLFSSPRLPSDGVVTFTVLSVEKTSTTYEPAQNLVTEASIDTAP